MRRIGILTFLVLLVATAAHADFLLWIDKPKGRTNPNDLQSPLRQPTMAPATNTPVAVNSSTVSPTRSSTGTPSAIPTATPTASPTNVILSATSTPTFTPSPTQTATPSVTETSTLTPVYSATDTPTASPTPSQSATFTETMVVVATPTPTSVPTIACGTPLYDFESTAQGWTIGDSGAVSVAQSTAQAACGTGSLALVVNLAAGTPSGSAQVDNPAIVNNGCKIIRAKVYIPAGMSGDATGANFFAQTGSGWDWNAAWHVLPAAGGWVDLELDLAGVVGTINRIGIQFNLGSPTPGPDFTGTVYVDSIQVGDSPTCGTPTPTPTPGGCNAFYNFETNAEGWVIAEPGAVSVAQSTAMADCGTGSLALNVAMSAGANATASVQIETPAIVNNGCKMVSARVYVPAGYSQDIAGAQVFALHGTGWTYVSNWTNIPNAGGWTTVTLDLTGISATINRIGVQFSLGGPPPAANFTGTVYVDKVEIIDNPSCVGTPTPTPNPSGCSALYSFDGGVDGWVIAEAGGVSVANSAAYQTCGPESLAISVALTSANPLAVAQIEAPPIVSNGLKVITAKLYVPAGMSADIGGAQLFALTGAGWAWNANWTNVPNAGGWVDLTLDLGAVPNGDAINRLGVQISLGGPPPAPDYTGVVYLDEVRVTDKVVTPTPTVTPGAVCLPASGTVSDEKAWWLDMPPGTEIWGGFFSSSSVAPHNVLGNNHLAVNATWAGWFSNAGLRFPGWVVPPDPLLIDVTAYDNFEFWIRAAGPTNNACNDINLTLLDHAGAASGSGVNLVAGGYLAMPLSETYTEVKVPLCAFSFAGMDTSSIASLVVGIQGNADTGNIQFYVDDGYFRKY